MERSREEQRGEMVVSHKETYDKNEIKSLDQGISGSGVSFRFTHGTIESGELKDRMERNISAVLTEIDRAGRAGTALNLSGISMEPVAKNRLAALWGNIHFTCDRSENVSKCLRDMQGYQVRAIPITVKPINSDYDGSLNRELTLSLSRSGVITGVRLAWETQEDISKILTSPKGDVDARQRREILKCVEDYRLAYNDRNIKTLNQIYRDDALIITGSMVNTRKTGDGVQMEEIEKYKVQNKTQYLTDIERWSLNNKRINVEFDHISVVRHGAKPNFYGVILHQKLQTSDGGWLFLLWDFNDPKNPQILVRTWQSDKTAAKEDLYSFDDFLYQTEASPVEMSKRALKVIFSRSEGFYVGNDIPKDLNGNNCAVLRIMPPDGVDITKVQPMGSVLKYNNDGRVVKCFVPEGIKRVDINVPGYDPLTINLKDYGIEDLQSRQVIDFKLRTN